jgi:hypothetical protein
MQMENFHFPYRTSKNLARLRPKNKFYHQGPAGSKKKGKEPAQQNHPKENGYHHEAHEEHEGRKLIFKIHALSLIQSSYPS